jgi:hypothetical protein
VWSQFKGCREALAGKRVAACVSCYCLEKERYLKSSGLLTNTGFFCQISFRLLKLSTGTLKAFDQTIIVRYVHGRRVDATLDGLSEIRDKGRGLTRVQELTASGNETHPRQVYNTASIKGAILVSFLDTGRTSKRFSERGWTTIYKTSVCPRLRAHLRSCEHSSTSAL